MMRLLLGALFGLWRHTLGAILPDACRFRPTCSRYATEALLRRGIVVGLAMTVWRILRCNPFGRGGYDPVVRSVGPCRATGIRGRPDRSRHGPRR